MRKKKKKSLVKSLTFSLFVIAFLSIISVLNFQYYSNINKTLDLKKEQYNNIHSLLNELSSTIDELDRLLDLYLETNKDEFLDEYYYILDIYNGNVLRSSEKYFVYPNIKMPYSTIIENEIELYNPHYKTYIKTILSDFNQVLQNQDNLIKLSNESKIKKMSYTLIPHDFNNDIENKGSSVLVLNKYIRDLNYKLNNYNNKLTTELNNKFLLFGISLHLINSTIFLFGFYFMLKIYVLLIRPLKKGYIYIDQISKGNEDIRLSYKYNNELTDIVNSFNNYLDISQNSFKLIEDQYNKLKIYSDIGEINYFEYDFTEGKIKILYSKKFIKKYNLRNNDMTYTLKSYVSMIHKDDVDNVLRKLNLIRDNERDEYRLEFRIKYPEANDYCYISSMGQRKESESLFIGVQVDITDLKVTKNLLQQQEEQYRLIIENSTDLIAKISPSGEILYASKSYREIFDDKSNIKDFNKNLIISNLNWLEHVKKPPYSTQEKLLVNTSKGEKWISWNNDAIVNNKDEIEYIITVGHDVTELQKINEKLKYDSEHDLLTGLLNRRGLFDKINDFKNINRIAAFFIDINNFKNINDLYGHEIGDMIIMKVAEDLTKFESLGCTIGRLSGDEFLILVPNYHSLNYLKNKLLKDTQKNYHIKNNDIFISTSIGYSLYPEDTDNLNKLISFADIAMYQSKLNHLKNCLRFTYEMYEQVNKKVEMANDLKKAIDNDEFEIYFQPIININNGKNEYFESLVRWHSNKGMILPGDFLPIAEESGFIQSLDLLFIRRALSQFYELRKVDKYYNTKLSLNVAPIMILKSDFPRILNNLVKIQKLKNYDICIEISENTFVNNIDQTSYQIIKLRELGFLVALDDFGREYSSLSILDKVEFDIIKIDRLFTENLHFETNKEIIKMILKIARLKNRHVIVEGIETEIQKDSISKLGCNFMQGFYFSYPQKKNYFLQNE